jgi:26S proteasome regulatory subunit T3
MSLADDVDLESFVARPDKLSGAEIASICLEAGELHRAFARRDTM